jgi:dolichyl-phosphate beta-glucosyltransferase
MFSRMAGGAEPAADVGAGVPTLTIVIPAYNEELRLPTLLETLAGSAEGDVAAAGLRLAETLIVDDGSTDRTLEILAGAERDTPTLRAVRDVVTNRGKGGAIAAGVDHAAGDYVLFADVDLSTPLGELRKLAEAVRGGADLAVGSRALAGSVVERGPAHRKLLGKSFNATVRALTGLRLKDTQCGFKLLPTGIARTLLGDQRCSGFAFDVELLMRADAAGLRIAEVPVVYVHDARSQVRVVGATFEMLRDVTSLAYQLRVRRSGPEVIASRRDSVALPADNPD